MYKLGLFVLLLLIPAITMAQVEPLNQGQCIVLGINCPDSGALPVIAFIYRIINVGLLLVGILAVGAIMYGGARYILSRGNEEEARSAKMIIIYAVGGLVVIGLASAIVRFVIGVLQ